MDLSNNKGVIFKNKDKKEDRHPDYKGQIRWKDENIDIVLYLNESKTGLKYFGVVLSPEYIPDKKQETHDPGNGDNSELPF